MSDHHHAVCAFDTRESSALSSPQARSHLLRRWPASALCAAIASALPAAGFAPGARAQLEEVFVTAQRRELGLQDSALSIAAFSGQTLEQAQIFNTGDLAQQTSGISFTSISPFDMELNIRGVMNTRLDAPSAPRPSSGITTALRKTPSPRARCTISTAGRRACRCATPVIAISPAA